MAQSRQNGDFFVVTVETTLSSPTATIIGILNQAGVPVFLHKFTIGAKDNNLLAFGDAGISLNRGSGGSITGSVTPVALKADSGAVGVKSAGFFAISGTGWTIMQNFGVNVRKGFTWEAKRGKEYRMYGATDSFALRHQTGASLGGKTIEFTMVFEE